MNEKDIAAQQRLAYENRDLIQPGDALYLTCTEANDRQAGFAMPGGTLLTAQTEAAPISPGDRVKVVCLKQIVMRNSFGSFVDYEFSYEHPGMEGRFCTINGPDAQGLIADRYRPIVVRNRDIPLLQDVLPAMQAICQTEKLQTMQRQRMQRLTASLTGMPGSGTAQGLDAAMAALDELSREQGEACREYARILRRAQHILNGIQSRQLRAFVMMKYVMSLPDAAVRKELGMTRRGMESAKHAAQDAPDMASVEWRDRYAPEK